MSRSPRSSRQKGMTLISVVLLVALVSMVAIVVAKVTPTLIEYFSVLKDANAVAASKDIPTVPDIRNALTKRLQMDEISGIAASDLDISKESGEVVISFAYTRKIPLYGPVSLSIDYSGSTSRGGK